MGRLVKTTHPDTTAEESTYDAEGRRLTSKDRAGRVTSYQYDANGRLTFTRFPAEDGQPQPFTENRYDLAGRLVQTIDARLKSTFYEYDEAGRRTKVRDPLNNETVFGYDANGNQTSVRDPKGNTTTYEYDELNRRVKTVFPDGTFSETAYDALGRRTAEKEQAGKVTRFQYDKLSRLNAVIDAGNGEAKPTVYAYDELSNRTSQTDANVHTTRFEYDRLGRETARILHDDSREAKTYDAAGNVGTWTDFIGRTTSYDFDSNSRLLTKTYSTGRTVRYTYSSTGRRLTTTDARGVTTYAYDVRDRLASVAQPDGNRLDFTHDPNGGRLSLVATVNGVSHTTAYTYDDASRLDTVIDQLARIHDFDWDENGNRATLAHPNGVTTAYSYNTLNRLTSLDTAGPLGVVQSYAFTLGPSGNRERIDEAGGISRVYGYDSLYRLTSETVTANGVLDYSRAWTYDPVGNRLQQTTTVGPAGTPSASLQAGSIDYTYDARDRLLSEVFAGGAITNYTYDANGNLVTKSGELTLTWDEENRLIKAEKPDGTVIDHAYDADGNRIQTKTTLPGQPTQATNFLVDTSASLSHVAAETDGAGALKALYIRSDDELLAVMRPTGPTTWSTRYFHSDHLGSIRALTDEAGNVTDTYDYDAHGTLLSHVGSDPQPYAFAGEPREPNTQWQYHRARWMDPSSGRFTAMDAFQGFAREPLSLHKYLYAAADPVNKKDPTGRFSIGQVSVSTAMAQTIQVSAMSRAVAAITILAVVAGAVGTAIVGPNDPVNPRFNRMRVQLQDETTKQGSNHTYAKDAVNRSEFGVTGLQMRRAMDDLYRTYPVGAKWYPQTLDSELVSAIIIMSQYIGAIVAGGGVIQGGQVRSVTWEGRDRTEYRLDLENLRGHNLRQ